MLKETDAIKSVRKNPWIQRKYALYNYFKDNEKALDKVIQTKTIYMDNISGK